MRTLLLTTLLGAVMISLPASAYRTKNDITEMACTKDGTGCAVYCDNGFSAGTMYWKGGVWTDFMESDADMDAEAKKIVASFVAMEGPCT